MAMKNEREYRAMPIMEKGNDENECRVQGYATTFNQPYVLFSDDGIDYKEIVDSHAFDECDMSDVVFQYNHSGMVFARSRAKAGKSPTLQLNIDNHGLSADVDLSSTKASREIFEAIDSGLIDKMSFGFVVEEDEYDRHTHTRTIKKVKKLYDVSAVDFPANPNTQIDVATRSAFDGFIESEKQELLKAEQRENQKRKIRILSEM